MYGAVKEVVESFTGGLTEASEVQAGVNKAARKIGDLLDQKKIAPDDIHLMEMINEVCAHKATRWYSQYGHNAIDTMVNNNSWGEVNEAVTASSDFNIIFTKYVANTFIPQYEGKMAPLAPLYSEMSSTQQVQFHGGIISPDEPERVAEGGRAPESSALEKYVQIRNEKVQRWTGITQETMWYDKSGGQILQRIRDLSDAVARLQRRWIITGIRDAAFTGNSFAISANTWFNYGGSTAAVFSSDHSAIDGQTNQNTVTSAATITTDNMSTVSQRLRNMTNFYGRKLNLSGDTLLVGPDNEFAAAQMANSTIAFDSSEGGNNANPVKLLGLIRNVIADAELGTGEWYYGDFKNQYVWQWVERPNTIPMGQRQDLGYIAAFLIQMAGGFGPRDYRWVVKCSAS